MHQGSRSKGQTLGALIVAAFCVYMAVNYLIHESDNYCRMTFMLEPPRFIDVPVAGVTKRTNNHQTIDAQPGNDEFSIFFARNYKLYLYSELDFHRPHQDYNTDLRDAVSVLFIPGNAGSYQQTRSLASICIRLQISNLDSAKFVFYTVDFNGQFSGIHGRLLDLQIRFVAKAIAQIRRNHQGSIIVVGHSVGGFIAKSLYALEDFDPNSISFMISLAGPLTRPVLFFDNEMRFLYDKTNRVWYDSNPTNNASLVKFTSPRPSVTSVSISGGFSDRLVPPHLAFDPSYDVSLITSSLQDVWLPTDHVSITWCREHMYKLADLLSSIVDKKLMQVFDKPDKIKSIVRSKLTNSVQQFQSDRSRYLEWGDKPVTRILVDDVRYSTNNLTTNELKVFSLQKDKCLTISVEHYEILPSRWISGCEHFSADSVYRCLNRTDLWNVFRRIPSRYYEPHSSFMITATNFLLSRGINHIVIDLNPHKSIDERVNFIGKTRPGWLQLTLNNETDHLTSVRIPNMMEVLASPHHLVGWPIQLLSDQRITGSSYSKIILKKFSSLTQTFTLRVNNTTCRSNSQPRSGLILFQVPWSGQSHHSLTTSEKSSSLKVDLRLVKIPDSPNYTPSYVELFLDDQCDYEFSINFDIFKFFDTIVQRRLSSIITTLAFLVAYEVILSVTPMQLINPKDKTVANDSKSIATLKFVTGYSISFLIVLVSAIILQYLAPNLESSQTIKHLEDEMILQLFIFIICKAIIIATDLIIATLIEFVVATSTFISAIPVIFRIKEIPKNKIVLNGCNSSNRHIKQACPENQRNNFCYWLPTVAVVGVIFSSSGLLMSACSILVNLWLAVEKKKLEKNSTNPQLEIVECFLRRRLLMLSILSVIPSAVVSVGLGLLSANSILSLHLAMMTQWDMQFLASTLSLILLAYHQLCPRNNIVQYSDYTHTWINCAKNSCLYVGLVAALVMVESNLHYLSLIHLIVLVLVFTYRGSFYSNNTVFANHDRLN